MIEAIALELINPFYAKLITLISAINYLKNYLDKENYAYDQPEEEYNLKLGGLGAFVIFLIPESIIEWWANTVAYIFLKRIMWCNYQY